MQEGKVRFIIVRHGETEWNVQQRYQGQLDSPLTANGIRQAEAIAQRLASVHADALVCSDLKRASDTAAAIIRQQRPDLPVRYTEALRERNFGTLGGLTRAEAIATLPGVLADYTSGNADYTPPQGESLRDLYNRATAVMNALAVEYAQIPAADERAEAEGRGNPAKRQLRTVIVVTHGGFLGQFMRGVLSIPLEAPRSYKFVNAAYNEFSCSVVRKNSSGAEVQGNASNALLPHTAGASGAAVQPDSVGNSSCNWLLHVWGDVAHLGNLDASDDL